MGSGSTPGGFPNKSLEDYDNRGFGNIKDDQSAMALESALESVLQGTESSKSAFNITRVPYRPTSEPNDSKIDGKRSIPDEDAIQIMFRFSNDFMPLVEDKADTLIYLGVPPRLSSQSDYEYTYIEQLFRRPYLLRSDTLKKLGPCKLTDFLGPVSARVERRLKKIGIQKHVQNPEAIKYYIDLSPAIDGDEALSQVAQLTVPAGALTWHQRAQNFGISAEFVCGRDELYVPARPSYTLRDAEMSSEEEDEIRVKKANAIKEPSWSENFGKTTAAKQGDPPPSLHSQPSEDEHSSLRHCTTTARLLHAIAGNNPKLNSAPKAWAFCMLANYYGCAHTPEISTHITSWLLQSGNINFIQVNPDVAYRMAIATQSIWLMRCTFAILVGQQAMIEGANDLNNGFQSNLRKLNHVAADLDDDDINRIDHAASNLIRRVKSIFEEIAVSPGIWTSETKEKFEMEKLNDTRFDDEESQRALQHTRDCFRNYVRRIVYMTISDSYPADNKNVDPYVTCGMFATYGAVPKPLKLLTQHFWDVLRKEEYARDYLDNTNNQMIWEQTQESLRLAGILKEPNIPYVSKKGVLDAVKALNYYIRQRYEATSFIPGTVFDENAQYADKEHLHRAVTPPVGSPNKKVKLSPMIKSSVFTSQANEFPPSNTSTPTRSGAQTPTMKEAKPKDSVSEEDSDWEKPYAPSADVQSVTDDEDWEDALGGFNISSKSELQPSTIHKKSRMNSADAGIASDAINSDTYRELLIDFGDEAKETERTSKFRELIDESEMYDTVFNSSTPNQPKSVPPQPTSLPFRGMPLTSQAHAQAQPETHDENLRKASVQQTLARDQQISDQILRSHFDSKTAEHAPYAEGSDQKTSATYRTRPVQQESNNFTDNRAFVDDEAEPVHKAPKGFKYPHELLAPIPKQTQSSLQNYHKAMLPEGSSTGDRQDFRGFKYSTSDILKEYYESPQSHGDHQDTQETLPAEAQRPERNPSPDINANLIAGMTLLGEISIHMHRRLHTMLQPGYITDQTCDFDIPVTTIGTLLCLGEDEYKYLPLWAYGLDDGSGGVFDDGAEVPDAPDVGEGGFRGGAMGIIPGVGSSSGGSGAGSEFEDLGSDAGVSTVGKASRYATDGTSTETVISMEE